ncbi:MAG: hypothetical protein ACXVBF_13190, partial [Flavisolibacter sp.]
MKRSQHISNARHICSSILMVVTLMWLTVSTPFVYQAQKTLKETHRQTRQADNSNPFSNTTEEKNESTVNTLSEY